MHVPRETGKYAHAVAIANGVVPQRLAAQTSHGHCEYLWDEHEWVGVHEVQQHWIVARCSYCLDRPPLPSEGGWPALKGQQNGNGSRGKRLITCGC